MAIVTTQGLLSYDNTLFSTFQLPENLEPFRDTIIDVIMSYAGQNCVRYPNPDMMHLHIDLFFKQHYWTFKKLEDTRNFEYNPIHNYDRHELWNDTGNNTTQKGANSTSTARKNRSSQVDSTSTTDTETENKVSAFNSSDYQPQDYQTMESQTTGHSTGTDTETSGEEAATTENTDFNSRNDHMGYMYGNIGVTSTQELIEAERKIAMFDIFQTIAYLFEDELTIPVY